ncbi:hypothetical protein K7640_09710 [Micromonospora sp. PLK6-60]|uniref:hypothetical protein n=1 Tax=Micromonospora sp. PLK6-60 TaxID=2873383 RepID=UPI001CA62D00|nr:hypothetical protein [Micromonospora sp. PLK6-60]MBY8872114.1 hypothetical protein [Micromonospora sp. PLK6-60]
MSTSIEDLLSFEEEPPPGAAEPGGGWARAVLRTLAATVAIVVVVVAGLRLVGLQISLLAVVVAALALLAVRRVTRALAPSPPPPGGTRAIGGEEDGHYNFGARDALRTAIRRWEVPLDWSATRPERFANTVLPRLAELADERLRQRHGVTREADPDRARALLGDRLWTFLDRPPRRPPSPRDLAAIVAELEKI